MRVMFILFFSSDKKTKNSWKNCESSHSDCMKIQETTSPVLVGSGGQRVKGDN